jgi:hypothetical protein
MATQKVITVRLCQDDARRAEMTARVDGISVNELFRLALLDYIEAKRATPDFMARARAMIARDAELVGGLQ